MKARSLLSVLAILGCSSERAQTVTLAAPPAAASAPRAAALPPPAAPATARRTACLMLYECGCNSACTEVDRPADDLRPGMRVNVVLGPLKGTPVFVAESRTKDGEPIFTVQRADPKDPIVLCSARARGPLVGYLCGASDLSAARACTTCE